MPEAFLRQPAELRREALGAAAEPAGRTEFLLEKDLWVVLSLEILFSAAFGSHLAFKGGTSLSKAYGAIKRFSEDVDLTYDVRQLVPTTADPAVLDGLSASQADRIAKKIRRELLPEFIHGQLLPTLEAGFADRGLEAKLNVDDCNVFVAYEPATDFPDYVRPAVKLELGGRATGEPVEMRDVVCYAAEHLTDFTFPAASPRVMRVERTFWEKATAMHVFCVQGRYRGAGVGYARHWHDLVRLDESGLADSAIAARDIALMVASHKAAFFPEKAPDDTLIDYHRVVSGDLRLVAEDEAFTSLATDYGRMVEAGLLADNAESFEDLMARCADLQERANQGAARPA